MNRPDAIFGYIEGRFIPLVFSGFATVVVAFFFLSFWQEYRKQEQKLIEEITQEETSRFAHAISEEVKFATAALERMAQRWEMQGGTNKEAWVLDAKNYVEDFYALTTVEWVDNTYHVKWVEPLEGNEKALGLNIVFNDERKKALEGAAEEGIVTLTHPIDLVQGYRAFIVYIPIYVQDSFEGFIVGIYNTDLFLNSILSDDIKKFFNVNVRDSDLSVYESSQGLLKKLDFVSKETIELYNREWTLIVSPNEEFIQKNQSIFSYLILVMGMIFSLLVGVCLYLAFLFGVRSKLLSKKSLQLESSEARMRSVLDNTADGLFTTDQEGVILSFNKACEQIFGYGSWEVVGKNIKFLIPTLCHISDMKKAIGRVQEYEGKRKDQSVFSLELSVGKILADKSEIYNGIIRDTTSRKTIENNAALLRRVAIAANEAQDFDDLLLKVIFLVCETLQWSVGHVYVWDKEKQKLVPTKHWYFKKEQEQDFLSFKQVTESTEFDVGEGLPGRVYKENQPLWLEDVSKDSNFPRNKILKDMNVHAGFGVPVSVDGTVEYVIEFFDINIVKENDALMGLLNAVAYQLSRVLERTRIEQEIIEAKKFQDLIMSHIPDFVFVKDEKFRIVEANKSFLNVYPEDMRSKVIGYTTLEEYNDQEAEEFLANDRIAFQEGSSEVEESILFPDGERRVLSTRKVCFQNANGENFILGIGRDITEKKEVEEKIKQANEELEEFSYRTSHDLRSPLVSSISLLGLVRDAIQNNEKDVAIESVDHIHKSLTKLESLVHDILKLTKAKNLIEAEETVDIEVIAQEALEKFSHMEHFDRLIVEKDFQFSKKITLKKSRMVLIVENMISNAIKYQDVKEKQSRVKISTYKEDGSFVFEVKDNGLGIPKERQEKMFQMFQRFHNKVSFGSGLGLYMVKKSANILGGDVFFEDPGKGAIFKFVLLGEKL